jgi:hypothetical protein
MFEITWNESGRGKFYFEAGKYILKMKRIGERWLYEVWEYEELKFNTWYRTNFMRLASKICLGERFSWADYA